jgi:hypothetical protein
MLEPNYILTSLWRPPVPISPNPSGYYLAVGPKELLSWALCTLCPALNQGGQVYWVDAGNRFDAYGLGEAAKALNLSPQAIMSRVWLSRPFSAFQLEALVTRKLSKMSPHIPVILSDPLGQFYDEEIKDQDANKVFQKFLSGLKQLPMTVLALAVKRQPPKNRAHFSLSLAQSAQATAHLNVDHGDWSLETVHLNMRRLDNRR